MTALKAPPRRPPALRRSWLFVAGADTPAQQLALASGADVLVVDLEEFTAPAQRLAARQAMPALLAAARARAMVAAVRINPLAGDGLADLQAVMPGAPDALLLPHTHSTAQIDALAALITTLEAAHGLPAGGTEIVPVLESALGVYRGFDIAAASPRVSACLLASEDLSADLGAERSREGIELHALRQRFLVDCRAAHVLAIDCPYNYRDSAGLRADLRWARRLGFKARCTVYAEQVAEIHAVLTPSAAEIARARARLARVQAGENIAPPDAHTARRLLARHAEFAAWERQALP